MMSGTRWAFMILVCLTISIFIMIAYGSVISYGSIISYGSLVIPEERGVVAQELEDRHLLIISMPQLKMNQLERFLEMTSPSFKQDIQLAGISMRTEKGIKPNDNWFTMATGYRGIVPDRWQIIDHKTKPTGLSRITQSQVNVWDPFFMKKLQEHDMYPGWAAELLHQHGIKTCRAQVGSSTENDIALGSFLLMNRSGQVNVCPSMNDIEQLWSHEQRSFTVVDIDSPTMESADNGHDGHDWSYVNSLIEKAGNQDAQVAIWVVAPIISDEAQQQGQWLAPIMTWQHGQGKGWLRCATTRQAGIISHVDILPSILHYFELNEWANFPGKSFVNRTASNYSMKTNTVAGDVEHVTAFFEHMHLIFGIYEQRRTIISVYLSIMIVCLVLATLYGLYIQYRQGHARGEFKNHSACQFIHIVMGAILLTPVFFLWFSMLTYPIAPLVWISLLLSVSVICSWVLYRFVSQLRFLFIIAVLNAEMIILDTWRDSVWMQRSFLGYDPIIGARFYGLGNEYAGILAGSVLLAVTIYLLRYKKSKFVWVLLVYGLVIYTIFAPHLGTNAGAMIATSIAFIVSIVLFFPMRLSMSRFLAFLGIGILCVIGLAFLHVRGEHTHIGAAMRLVAQGDMASFGDIIMRKVHMNMKLIRVSLWGKLLTTSLLVLAVLGWRLHKKKPQSPMERVWSSGFRAMIVGALMFLLVNDSGVVAAGAMMIFITFPYLYIQFLES